MSGSLAHWVRYGMLSFSKVFGWLAVSTVGSGREAWRELGACLGGEGV